MRIIRIGGHTAATSAIWMPNEKILFVGDAVWVEQHPYMAQGNSKEWLDGLTYIRKLQGRPDRARPRPGLRPRGHGAHVGVHPLYARPHPHVPPPGPHEARDGADRPARGGRPGSPSPRRSSRRPNRRSSRASAASGTKWKRPPRRRTSPSPRPSRKSRRKSKAMAQAVQRGQVTPADELRDLLDRSEKRVRTCGGAATAPSAA